MIDNQQIWNDSSKHQNLSNVDSFLDPPQQPTAPVYVSNDDDAPLSAREEYERKLADPSGEDSCNYLKLRLEADSLYSLVKDVQTGSLNFVKCAQKLFSVSFSTSLRFKEYYDLNVSKYRQLSRVTENAVGQVRYDRWRELSQVTHDKIEAPLSQWLGEYQQVMSICKQRDAAEKKLSHYRSKLSKLQTADRNMKMRGERISEKALERLRRNERKLELADKDYFTQNEACVEELRKVLEMKLELVDSAFKYYLQIQTEWLGVVSNNYRAVYDGMKRVDEIDQQPLKEGFHPDNYRRQQEALQGLEFNYTADGEDIYGDNESQGIWKSLEDARKKLQQRVSNFIEEHRK